MVYAYTLSLLMLLRRIQIAGLRHNLIPVCTIITIPAYVPLACFHLYKQGLGITFSAQYAAYSTLEVVALCSGSISPCLST